MDQRHECNICNRSFRRSSHLTRHYKKHDALTRYSCPFCSCSYSRSDAARRHAKSCRERNGQPLPESLRRGKNLSACDNCAQAKLACDTELPCESCLAHGKDCSYSRVEAGRRDSLSSWVSYEFLLPSAATLSSVDNHSAAVANESEPQMAPGNSCAIPFLLNYTDSNNKTILDFRRGIEFTTLGDSDDGPAVPVQDSVTEHQTESPGPTAAIDELALNIDFAQEFPLNINFDQDPWDWSEYLFPLPSINVFDNDWSSPSVVSEEASSNALEKRAAELAQALLSAQALAPPNVCSGLDSWKPRVRELVTATSLSRAIRSFSKRMTPHYHWIRPLDIDAQVISMPLLMVIFLAGSIYSSMEQSYHFALGCFDLAEHIIFEFELLKVIIETQDCHRSGISSRHLELLNAAIVIIYLQMGMKDNMKRWRIRTLRYPILLKAARVLALFSVPSRHVHDVHSLTPADQVTWTRHQSLLRTAYSIFFIDCEFAIFYRQPPRLMISEMVCDSPAGAAVFTAPDFDSWATLMVNVGVTDNPSMAVLLKCIMKDILDKEDEERLNSLSIFALFHLLCGLHHLIFLSQAGDSFANMDFLLDKAVRRWQVIWRRRLQEEPIDHPSEVIMVRVGSEFWWLAKLMLRISDQGDKLSFYDVDSLDPLNRLLQKYRDVEFG